MTSLLAALIFGITAGAHAGGHGPGNGGGLHRCDAPSTSTLQDRFFDLYEMERVYYLHLDPALPKTEDELIQDRLAKLHLYQPDVASRIEALLPVVRKKLHFDRESVYSVIKDASILKLDAGCEYAQLAIWDERTNLISINQPLYERMVWSVDRVALLFHEAAYKIARLYEPKLDTSDGVRHWVAELFSDQPLQVRPFAEKGALSIYAELEAKYDDYRTGQSIPEQWFRMSVVFTFADLNCYLGKTEMSAEFDGHPEANWVHREMELGSGNRDLVQANLPRGPASLPVRLELRSTSCPERRVYRFDAQFFPNSLGPHRFWILSQYQDLGAQGILKLIRNTK